MTYHLRGPPDEPQVLARDAARERRPWLCRAERLPTEVALGSRGGGADHSDADSDEADESLLFADESLLLAAASFPLFVPDARPLARSLRPHARRPPSPRPPPPPPPLARRRRLVALRPGLPRPRRRRLPPPRLDVTLVDVRADRTEPRARPRVRLGLDHRRVAVQAANELHLTRTPHPGVREHRLAKAVANLNRKERRRCRTVVVSTRRVSLVVVAKKERVFFRFRFRFRFRGVEASDEGLRGLHRAPRRRRAQLDAAPAATARIRAWR